MVRPPYQEVLRLYAVAEDWWPLLDAAYPTISLVRLPMHRFLNLVWAYVVTHLSEEDRERFLMELAAPIPGQPKQVSETTVEQEGEMFMSAMGTLMGGT